MRYTILIAEDDVDIIEMLKLYIDPYEFQVICACDGQQAMECLRRNKIDLALVDLMMPKMNGYEFIRAVRKESNIPVIILSAKNEDTDKVKGLNIGADAYITKPFNPFEVIAYMKAMLRRFYRLGCGENSEMEYRILTLGELELESDRLIVRKNGTDISLTSSEYKILAKMMRTPGRIYTKTQLYKSINNDFYETDENTIMVHISNIRSKIEDNPAHPKYIKTIRGLGYKIEG